MNAPLILVPNTTLLDNHQLDLAEELSRQKYAVVASTGSVSQLLSLHQLIGGSNLRSALSRIETERKTRVSYLSVNYRPNQKKFKNILDEEMGFLD